MKYFVCLGLLILLIISMLMGCAKSADKNVFGKYDNDISVGSGQPFIIQLEESPENGYAWAMSISDKDIVSLFNNKFERSTEGPIVLGTSGMRTLSFRGMAKGTSSITLVYENKSEESSQNEVIVYNVTVE